MEKLEIETADGADSFRPGQALEGTVRWNLQENPESIEVSLCWHTAGKGTEDVGVVETLRFEAPGSLGAKDFRFELPAGPYSFSGSLISIIWAVEAAAWPMGETVKRQIIVSPTGKEIVATGGRSGPDTSE